MNLKSRIHRYVSDARVPPAEAAGLLRLAFAAMFLGQTFVALLVALAVGAVTDTSSTGNSVLGIVLLVLALLQGPAGLAAGLAPLPEPDQARIAALHRTLLAAVLLSTPAWYLAFLFAAGGGGWPVIGVGALLAIYWLAGVLLATRLGTQVHER